MCLIVGNFVTACVCVSGIVSMYIIIFCSGLCHCLLFFVSVAVFSFLSASLLLFIFHLTGTYSLCMSIWMSAIHCLCLSPFFPSVISSVRVCHFSICLCICLPSFLSVFLSTCHPFGLCVCLPSFLFVSFCLSVPLSFIVYLCLTIIICVHFSVVLFHYHRFFSLCQSVITFLYDQSCHSVC